MNKINIKLCDLFLDKVKKFFFYLLAFFAVVIILPTISLSGIGFMISGLMCIFILPIKVLSFIVLPEYASHILFIPEQYKTVLNYSLVIPLTMIVGSILFVSGYFLWQLTLYIINLIGFYNIRK